MKIKSAIKTIVFNAFLIFISYQYLILNNENWGNVFKVYTYVFASIIFLVGLAMSKYPADKLKEYKEYYKNNKVFPFWVIMIPDVIIVILCAYNGYITLSIFWVLYILGQSWIKSALSK